MEYIKHNGGWEWCEIGQGIHAQVSPSCPFLMYTRHDSRGGILGRRGIRDKPQYSRVFTKDPLTQLPSFHLLSPLNYSYTNEINQQRYRKKSGQSKKGLPLREHVPYMNHSLKS